VHQVKTSLGSRLSLLPRSRELLDELEPAAGSNPRVLQGPGPAPLRHWAWLPREGKTSLRERLAATSDGPQDPDPSISPTFVAHNWFYSVGSRRRGRTLGRLEHFPAACRPYVRLEPSRPAR
jgi:hypothetical protein